MSELQIAIYARVSSERQANEHTIGSQVAALDHRVATDGFRVLPELRFIDDGSSGSSLVRPALERPRDVAAAGQLDRLSVHTPDRLARSYAHQVLLVDELRSCGVELVFLHHPLGRSAEDELLLQVQGIIAEYERAKTLERSRRGKRHAAQQGEVSVLTGAPCGYRSIAKREGGGQARYEIVLEEARVVRQSFTWVGKELVSVREVRRRLHQAAISTQTGKAWWDGCTILQLLTPRIKRFKERIATVERDLAAAQAMAAQQEELRLVIGRLEDFAATVRDNLDQLEWEAKRTIIRTLVKRVEIDLEEIRVIFRVGPEPPDRGGRATVSQDCSRRLQAKNHRCLLTWNRRQWDTLDGLTTILASSFASAPLKNGSYKPKVTSCPYSSECFWPVTGVTCAP